MQTVTSADGTRIAFWKSGRGAPLLLVHGASASHATTWRLVLPALESRFTVYAMDRRGRGGSGDGADYHFQREAEDVAAVVDAIGGRVHVLGHSFGALCALEAALLTPNVESLVLYEGVPLRGVDGYAPGTIDSLEARLAAGDVEGMLVCMLRDVAALSPQDIEALRSQPQAWQTRLTIAPTIPRELRAEERYTFEPARFRALLARTLLLVGGNSAAREMANARGVADGLARASVGVLPGQEHIAMYTAPDQFVDVIADFLGDAAD